MDERSAKRGEMVSGRTRQPWLSPKPNYYFLAHLQCSFRHFSLVTSGMEAKGLARVVTVMFVVRRPRSQRLQASSATRSGRRGGATERASHWGGEIRRVREVRLSLPTNVQRDQVRLRSFHQKGRFEEGVVRICIFDFFWSSAPSWNYELISHHALFFGLVTGTGLVEVFGNGWEHTLTAMTAVDIQINTVVINLLHRHGTHIGTSVRPNNGRSRFIGLRPKNYLNLGKLEPFTHWESSDHSVKITKNKIIQSVMNYIF